MYTSGPDFKRQRLERGSSGPFGVCFKLGFGAGEIRVHVPQATTILVALDSGLTVSSVSFPFGHPRPEPAASNGVGAYAPDIRFGAQVGFQEKSPWSI